MESCLSAIRALMPIVEAAGLPVYEDGAYDEWERLIWQCFDSLVIMAVTDGDTMAYRRFKQLGFPVKSSKGLLAFSACYNGNKYILNDIVCIEKEGPIIEWICVDNSVSNDKYFIRSKKIAIFSDFDMRDI